MADSSDPRVMALVSQFMDLVNEKDLQLKRLKRENQLIREEKSSEELTLRSEVDCLQNELKLRSEELEMRCKELREVRHENDLLVRQLQTKETLTQQAMSFAKSVLQSNGIVNSLPTFSEQIVLSERPNSMSAFSSMKAMDGMRLRATQSKEDETYESTRVTSNLNSKDTSDETYYTADSSQRSSLATPSNAVNRVDPNLCQQNQISSTVSQTIDILNQSVIATTNSSSFGFDENNNLKLKLVKVPINRMVGVTVAYIESPSNFWLHIDATVYNYLHVIQVKQEELCESANSRLTTADVEIGLYCAAIYPSDGYWYRAQVIDITYENPIEKDSIKLVKVFYIDWGNTEELPLSKVMKLSKDLTKRRQAIHCHLQGIDIESVKWPQKWIQKFKHLLEGKKLNATFHKGLKLNEVLDKWKYPTDLMITFEDETTENLINLLPIRELSEEVEESGEPLDQTIDLVDKTVESIDRREKRADTLDTLICLPLTNGHNGQSNRSLGTNDSNVKSKSGKSVSNQNCASNAVQCNGISNNVSKKLPKSMPHLNLVPDSIQIPPPIIPDSTDGLVVQVSHLISPSLFYLHIIDTQVGIAQFEDMEEQLNNFYSVREADRPTEKSDVRVGSFWCCRFSEDKNWYRIRVISVLKEKALVNYVDYGNEELIDFELMMPLTRKFATYPAFAVKCCLSSVAPVDSLEWPQTTTEYFNDLTKDKHMTAFISLKPTAFGFDSDLEIFLWTNDLSDKEILINSHLVINDFAITDNNEWVKEAERIQREKTPPEVMDQLIPKLNQSIQPLTNGHNSSGVYHSSAKKVHILPELPDDEESDDDADWDPMKEDNECNLNNYAIPPNNPGVATVGFRPERRMTCKFYGTARGCRMRDMCSFLHVDPNKRFEFFEAEEEETSIPEVELEVDSYVILKVISIQSPFSFYGILPFGPKPLNSEYLNENVNEFQEINDLSKLLKERYSEMSKKENLNIDHGIASLVAYRDKKSNTFYRGRVIGVDDDERNGDSICIVFNIDLGFNALVKRSDMFKLDAYLCQFPALAIQCSLFGVEPSDGLNWSEESISAFGEWTLNQSLYAHIMYGKTDDKYYIELIDREGEEEEEVFISNKLIARKLAQRVATNGIKGRSEDDIYCSDLD